MTAPRRRPGKREREAARAGAATIDPRQVGAVKVYARDYETAQLDGRPMHRMEAQDSVKAARAVLTPQEVAILDMVAGKGRSIADVAIAAGRAKADLEALFLTASTKLADHYEARPGDA